MSRFEQIFFDADGGMVDVGARLTHALRLRWTVGDRGIELVGTPEPSELPAAVGGTVEPNIYAETAPEHPSDVSIFDDMRWVMEFRVMKHEYHLQQETALLLFNRMASTLGWRSALNSEYATLLATQDAEHGYREYPEDTLSDATPADRWR